MVGAVVLDTNLMVLLVVGSTSTEYIGQHKRLQDYTVRDFYAVKALIGQFSDFVALPHILAEASSILRQIRNPARGEIQERFRRLIDVNYEVYQPSLAGAARAEFSDFGLTDAVILSFCDMESNGVDATLITADTKLAMIASSLGYSVIDYQPEFGE